MEVRGELFDGGSTAQRLVQGVLEAELWSGEFVDDARIPRVAPELGEPPADDGRTGKPTRQESRKALRKWVVRPTADMIFSTSETFGSLTTAQLRCQRSGRQSLTPSQRGLRCTY
jgi:hypothetical protein